MSNHIKDGLKLLSIYGIILVIYIIFLSAAIRFLLVYSIIMMVILAFLIFSETKRLAEKEKRGYTKVPCYPLKGLVIGFLGFSPILLFEIIYPFVNLNTEELNNVKSLALNALMAPLYPIYKLFNEMPIGYFLASLFVPIIAMIGYYLGHTGIMNSKSNKHSKKNT